MIDIIITNFDWYKLTIHLESTKNLIANLLFFLHFLFFIYNNSINILLYF